MKKDDAVLKMVMAGLFAALIYVATTVIRIQTPTNGYLNFGDCFILIAAWTLGPWYGFAAGGIGSALADLLAGYTTYVPGTFLIKGAMALLAAFLYTGSYKTFSKAKLVPLALGAVVAEVWMVFGYFLYESTLLGYSWGAAASIPANCIQGMFGLVAGLLLSQILIPLLARTGLLAPYVMKKKN